MIESPVMVFLQWVMIAIVAVGLGATWVRNGRGQSQKYGQLEEKVDNIDKKLVTQDGKLDNIKSAVEGQKLYCAKVSTSLTERVFALEKKPERKRKSA